MSMNAIHLNNESVAAMARGQFEVALAGFARALQELKMLGKDSNMVLDCSDQQAVPMWKWKGKAILRGSNEYVILPVSCLFAWQTA